MSPLSLSLSDHGQLKGGQDLTVLTLSAMTEETSMPAVPDNGFGNLATTNAWEKRS